MDDADRAARAERAARWLQEERHVLFACSRLAHGQGMDTEVVALSEPVWTHALDHPHQSEVLEVFRRAVDSAVRHGGNPGWLARTRCQLARGLWESERLGEAREQIDGAMSAVDLLGNSERDHKLAASALEHRCMLKGARGEGEAALADFAGSRETHRTIPNPYGRARGPGHRRGADGGGRAAPNGGGGPPAAQRPGLGRVQISCVVTCAVSQVIPYVISRVASVSVSVAGRTVMRKVRAPTRRFRTVRLSGAGPVETSRACAADRATAGSSRTTRPSSEPGSTWTAYVRRQADVLLESVRMTLRAESGHREAALRRQTYGRRHQRPDALKQAKPAFISVAQECGRPR